ncbi:MAG: TIGR02266 family protein [Deltaproteobacteria bacterium]|nr:TIGR02266 family protein [Deltaproteobacteria bacterium]
MNAERRKARRFELKARCWCEGPNCVLYVNILNASTGGLFVKTSTPFHPGDPLKLRWRLPGNDTDSEATAVVAWRREHQPGAGMGARFTDLPPATKETLRRMEGAEG